MSTWIDLFIVSLCYPLLVQSRSENPGPHSLSLEIFKIRAKTSYAGLPLIFTESWNRLIQRETTKKCLLQQASSRLTRYFIVWQGVRYSTSFAAAIEGGRWNYSRQSPHTLLGHRKGPRMLGLIPLLYFRNHDNNGRHEPEWLHDPNNNKSVCPDPMIQEANKPC